MVDELYKGTILPRLATEELEGVTGVELRDELESGVLDGATELREELDSGVLEREELAGATLDAVAPSE